MFFAKIWFVKTLTRIVVYESRVVNSNPGQAIRIKWISLKQVDFNNSLKEMKKTS